MPRDLSRVALGFLTERKHRPGKLVLAQRKKEVTLVLPQIAPSLQQNAPAIFASLQPRKMPGRNELRAQLVRPLDEPAELEVLIAHHARIRCAARFVFIGEVLDDVLLKLRRFVDEVIRNAKLVANRACVGNRLRATTFVFGTIHAILRPELERYTDDIVTLFQQQRRRGGGIYSTAHATNNTLTLLAGHKKWIIPPDPQV